ncbi:MAG: biosynthetic-type acetolactate synthase large subunit [Chitinivibrionales bacterium]|nr:biosynthetic-type acetolactate synthase large subunit [Chitinivibrionales bacterium]
MNTKKMTGAEALILACEKHGVTHIFGYPGGANIPIFDALIESPVKLILSRHEQGATHMADGYARATGNAGVVLVTSGPGATNTITGIMTAHMDSVPMIIICGQTITANLGLDSFQEADVSGISYPVVKHSYLIKNPHDTPRIVQEAFHIAESGRPGPVLIDVPKDVSSARIQPDFEQELELPGYLNPKTADKKAINAAARLLSSAAKPVILAGHGIIIGKAEKELKKLAETLHAPVISTLLGKGAIPETHKLSLGMLGMHGTAYANMAVKDTDCIISIGSRWDDRIVGDATVFCHHASRIHIDIDPAEHNKMIEVDIFINSDAKIALTELIAAIKPAPTKAWLEQVAEWKRTFPLVASTAHGLEAQYILKVLDEKSDNNTIIVTDVGQHQMWAAQFCKTTAPHNWLSSGGAGTMGFGFPAAIGAQIACPRKKVVAVVGDGGYQMTMPELATAAINKLPLTVLILDNRYLGMVRQWQDMFYDKRIVGVDLVGNPDFVKVAEAYGVKGFHLTKVKDVQQVLSEALAYRDGPTVIHAEVIKEDNVFPMIPAGASYDKMLLEAPKQKLAKPKGST